MSQWGSGRVTSSSPCLILVTRVEWSLLKSAPGAGRVYMRTGPRETAPPTPCKPAACALD
eukprot:762568-Pelagomonas_calceolata.AAC.1